MLIKSQGLVLYKPRDGPTGCVERHSVIYEQLVKPTSTKPSDQNYLACGDYFRMC